MSKIVYVKVGHGNEIHKAIMGDKGPIVVCGARKPTKSGARLPVKIVNAERCTCSKCAARDWQV